MNVDIDCCVLMVNDGPADHAKRRLGFVMTRHQDHIQKIHVKLGDMEGTFGQHGKYCRIKVDLVDAPPVGCLYIGSDFDELIDRAVDRAGRAVLKRLRSAYVGTSPKCSIAGSEVVGRAAVGVAQYAGARV